MPGEPLVLIHGFSATRGVWQPVLVSLERDHEVLGVLPGRQQRAVHCRC